MMGVPLMRTKLSAYAVGAFMGGLGGVAFATQVNGVFADRFNFSISIILLAMVVLGGMGNVWGVIDRRAAARLDQHHRAAEGRQERSTAAGSARTSTSRRTAICIFGLILVLMMLFRREGLFLPRARTRLVLHEQPSAPRRRPCTSRPGGRGS